MVYQTEKMLSEHRENLPESEVSGVESALADAKEALDSDDADRMKSALEALQGASHSLAQAAYASGQGAPGEGPMPGGPMPGGPMSGGGGADDSDDVIDADFEDA